MSSPTREAFNVTSPDGQWLLRTVFIVDTGDLERMKADARQAARLAPDTDIGLRKLQPLHRGGKSYTGARKRPTSTAERERNARRRGS